MRACPSRYNISRVSRVKADQRSPNAPGINRLTPNDTRRADKTFCFAPLLIDELDADFCRRSPLDVTEARPCVRLIQQPEVLWRFG